MKEYRIMQRRERFYAQSRTNFLGIWLPWMSRYEFGEPTLEYAMEAIERMQKFDSEEFNRKRIVWP